jgi:hypothetical protein
MNLKELLFAAARKPTLEKIDVSAWLPDQKVFVRVMSGLDADRYNSAVSKATEDRNYLQMEATLVALSLCDGDGNPLCTLQDVPDIMQWPSKRIDEIFRVASQINRIADQESLEGN